MQPISSFSTPPSTKKDAKMLQAFMLASHPLSGLAVVLSILALTLCLSYLFILRPKVITVGLSRKEWKAVLRACKMQNAITPVELIRYALQLFEFILNEQEDGTKFEGTQVGVRYPLQFVSTEGREESDYVQITFIVRKAYRKRFSELCRLDRTPPAKCLVRAILSYVALLDLAKNGAQFREIIDNVSHTVPTFAADIAHTGK